MPFDCEVSIIGARSAERRDRRLPAVRQRPRCRGSCGSPARPSDRRAGSASRRATCERVLGTFATPAFSPSSSSCARGRLIANEMAPRVHNSGHWTIEGATTSQFENHLRAILGLPLGATRARGFSAMINLIGAHAGACGGCWRSRGVHLHDYGKQPRPGRKVGHCTVVEPTAAARDARARRAAQGIGRGHSHPVTSATSVASRHPCTSNPSNSRSCRSG